MSVRDWFEANWDPELTLGEWWARYAAQWSDRELSSALAAEVEEERRRVGATAPPSQLGAKAIAPLIFQYGTDEQRSRLLPPTINGKAVWCELFSEPEAGSDLAGVRTRAVRDGEEWIVTGQKLWSSGAPFARWGLLVARTNSEVPKQQGLSCFVLEMNQPGVEVRPLRAMTGDAEFNEVFLTDARVPLANVLGDVDGGWPLVKAALANERNAYGAGGLTDNAMRVDLDQRAGDVAASERAGRRRGGMAAGGGAESLVRALLDQFGGDPVARDEVASLYSLLQVARYNGMRTQAAVARGQRPGPEASTAKLLTSRVTRALRETCLRIEGAHGMLVGTDAPMNGVVQRLALFSPAMSIMVGTDEVQRNIVGERVLGLPAEPD